MGAYKLQIKIGQAEFIAEGAEESVRTDYAKFLDALEQRSAHVDDDSKGNGSAGSASSGSGDVDDALLQAIFKADEEKGCVSLKVLPPAERTNRAADAAIIVLYGFHKMLGQSEAPVTKLISGLRESGITVDRFDRMIAVHSSLILRGGQKIGAKYRLNNQGMVQAAAMIREVFN